MKFNIILICFILNTFITCKSNQLTDSSSTQKEQSCEEINSDTRRALSEIELNQYAQNLPKEIHNNVQDLIQKKKYIDSVVVIRNCLNIDLLSARDLTKKIEVIMNSKQ